MEKKIVKLIGAAFGWGAKIHETQAGPSVIVSQTPDLNWEILSPKTIFSTDDSLDYESRLSEVHEFNEQLAKKVHDAKVDGKFPLVMGGDHSIAIGTWSGVVEALKANNQFGLIWIDAHMDSHTQETTPSHNIHGMPLAALMGYGEEKLVNVFSKGAKIDPRHVVLIGVRSFEDGEAKLLEKLKVKVFMMDEVKQLGFDKVFEKALEIVTLGTKGYGISLDLDAFDPQLVPGTGAPEPDGLNPNDVIVEITKLRTEPYFHAIEITEFDPTKDIDNKTATVAKEIILNLI